MKLQVINNAIAVITALRPALAKIRREDPALHKQIRDALFVRPVSCVTRVLR